MWVPAVRTDEKTGLNPKPETILALGRDIRVLKYKKTLRSRRRAEKYTWCRGQRKRRPFCCCCCCVTNSTSTTARGTETAAWHRSGRNRPRQLVNPVAVEQKGDCHTRLSEENQVHTYMHARIKFHAYSDIKVYKKQYHVRKRKIIRDLRLILETKAPNITGSRLEVAYA
jgi:hypothetical protein